MKIITLKFSDGHGMNVAKEWCENNPNATFTDAKFSSEGDLYTDANNFSIICHLPYIRFENDEDALMFILKYNIDEYKKL